MKSLNQILIALHLKKSWKQKVKEAILKFYAITPNEPAGIYVCDITRKLSLTAGISIPIK